MKIRLIGDVHGKTQEYQDLLKSFPDQNTIQVGDMGIGFRGVELPSLPSNNRWFRGNHDNPEQCRRHPNYLGDYGFIPEWNLFYIAGAFSIDWMMRREGVSWWKDEELSIPELSHVVDLYRRVKPRFVISHECPSIAATNMLLSLCGGMYSNGGYFASKMECAQSRTSQAMQSMFEAHRPEEWVFGHYHVDRSFVLNGTKFTCVAELSTYELDLDGVRKSEQPNQLR